MFDNTPGETTSLFDDDDFEDSLEDQDNAPAVKRAASRSGHFLGMTSFQRFIITLMVMIATCILGAMCLLLTGKIGLVV